MPHHKLIIRLSGSVGPALIAFFMIQFVGACGPKKESKETMPQRDITAVMNDHVNELMAIQGVTGVAIGALDDGTPCIMVLLLDDSDALKRKILDMIEGHPVQKIVTGEIKPLKDSQP